MTPLSARQLETLEARLALAVRALFAHRRVGGRVEDVAARVVHYDRAVLALREALLAEAEASLAPGDRPALETALRAWGATEEEPTLVPSRHDERPNVVVTVALGGDPQYARWQRRLVESCRHFDVAALVWTDAYPEGSRPHHESLFGFKWHALAAAFARGFERALWLDASVYLRKPPGAVFDRIAEDGALLVAGRDDVAVAANDKLLDVVRGKRRLSGRFVGAQRGSPLVPAMLEFENCYRFRDAIGEAAYSERAKLGYDANDALTLVAHRLDLPVTPIEASPFQHPGAVAVEERTPP